MSAHSKLAPSGASRWSECSASVPLIDSLTAQGKIKKSSSFWANEGAVAHDWAAKILDGKAKISDIQAGTHETDGTKFDLTEDLAAEMRECVGGYVELAQRLKTPEDFFVGTEYKAPIFYLPEDMGTLDRVLVSEKRLQVLDLKYGRGVIVEAKQNKQLAIYARSVIEDLRGSGIHDFPEEMLVVLTIHQPRIGDRGELTTKIWALTVKELYDFTDPIAATAQTIAGHMVEPEKYPVEFAPGDKTCQFCLAKGICGNRAEYMAEPIPFDVLGTFTDEDVADNAFECLEDSQLVQLITRKKEIIAWLNSLETDSQDRIESGVGIAGLKVVLGKEGNRAWSDATAADKLVAKFVPAKDRYTKKLLSVAQMEKQLNPHKADFSTRFRNRLLELITRPTGKHVLTLETDERPSITVKATDTFEDESVGNPLA